MPERSGAVRPLASVSTRTEPDTAALERMSLAYVDAARAHAKTCVCYSNPFEGLIRDFCSGAGPELDAVKRAGAPLVAFDAEPRDLPPAAVAFLREAALHARWLTESADTAERWAKADRDGSSAVASRAQQRAATIRGVVSAFQTLARRYNEWHPNAKVPAIAYGEYRPGGVKGQSFTLERAVLEDWGLSRAEFEKRKRELEYLPWIECFDGPCLQGY
jgi:hypothetical protein